MVWWRERRILLGWEEVMKAALRMADLFKKIKSGN